MQRSTERFLTTHTGSLPRPDDLIRTMYAKEEGVPVGKPAALGKRVREAVAEVVRRQVEAGVDVINDGEMSKPSYATYIKHRLSGFGGEAGQYEFEDLEQFPGAKARVFGDTGRAATHGAGLHRADRSDRHGRAARGRRAAQAAGGRARDASCPPPRRA